MLYSFYLDYELKIFTFLCPANCIQRSRVLVQFNEKTHLQITTSSSKRVLACPERDSPSTPLFPLRSFQVFCFLFCISIIAGLEATYVSFVLLTAISTLFSLLPPLTHSALNLMLSYCTTCYFSLSSIASQIHVFYSLKDVASGSLSSLNTIYITYTLVQCFDDFSIHLNNSSNTWSLNFLFSLPKILFSILLEFISPFVILATSPVISISSILLFKCHRCFQLPPSGTQTVRILQPYQSL